MRQCDRSYQPHAPQTFHNRENFFRMNAPDEYGHTPQYYPSTSYYQQNAHSTSGYQNPTNSYNRQLPAHYQHHHHLQSNQFAPRYQYHDDPFSSLYDHRPEFPFFSVMQLLNPMVYGNALTHRHASEIPSVYQPHYVPYSTSSPSSQQQHMWPLYGAPNNYHTDQSWEQPETHDSSYAYEAAVEVEKGLEIYNVTAVLEEEDGAEEEECEMELELNPQWMALFKKQALRRKAKANQREKAKKDYTVLPQPANTAVMQTRTHAVSSSKYGDKSQYVLSLETTLNAEFDRCCDKMPASFFPIVPLSF